MLTFRREDRSRVADGTITVTYRLWKTAKVRAGKRYRSAMGTLEIEDVTVLPAALIASRDIGLTGLLTVEAIRSLAGEHTRTAVGPDTLLHRVQFRFLSDVPLTPASPPALDSDALSQRLANMDRKSSRGSWTLSVLRLIDATPRVPARVLAADLGWERLDFKAHVRRLKRLGLTISHDVGYELSPLGRRYLTSATADAVSPRRKAGAGRSRRTQPRSRS